MRLAIIGPPSSGKSTLFAALAGLHAAAGSARPDQPHLGVVKVPDPRLDWLASIFTPKKITPAAIEFVDMPAPPEGGAGWSTEAVAAARQADGLVVVIPAFGDGGPSPAQAFDAVLGDLALNDLVVLEKRIEKLARTVTHASATQAKEKKEYDVLLLYKAAIEAKKPVGAIVVDPETRRTMKGFCLFVEKPLIAVLNIAETGLDGLKPPEWTPGGGPPPAWLGPGAGEAFGTARAVLGLCAKLEKDLAEMPVEERDSFKKDYGLTELASDRVIRAAYTAVNLITFFTGAPGERGQPGPELRAWTIPRGASALEAAGAIHTDIAKGFIRAEIVGYKHLHEAGDTKAAKAHGHFRLEGKEYVVQDGDLITVRFSPPSGS